MPKPMANSRQIAVEPDAIGARNAQHRAHAPYAAV